MSFVSYAQNCEDVILSRALKHVERGCYVDVGAQDPVTDSVTKAFYERGWRGVNIEPIRHWYDRLVGDRPEDRNFNVAASDRNGTLRLFEVEQGLSTVNAEFAAAHAAQGFRTQVVEVPARRLDGICDEAGLQEIHFLKIDVEGAEASVLAGFDFDRFRPWVILIEATEPNTQTPTYQQWEHLITGHGYDFVYFDVVNRFYLAREHSELRSAFAAPPNAFFDKFVRLAEWRLQTELNLERERREHLEGELQAAREREAKERFSRAAQAAQDPLSWLLNVYHSRDKLKAAFPGVAFGRYSDLLDWARRTAEQAGTDDYGQLASFAYWYRTNCLRENGTDVEHSLQRLTRALRDYGLDGTIRKVYRRGVARLGRRPRTTTPGTTATSEFLSLDLPVNGTVWPVGELCPVAGWLDSRPGSMVHIYVDGELCDVVPADVPRPDVTARRGTHVNCGFLYQLPPHLLAIGAHEVTVRFITESSIRLQRSARIEVRETSVGAEALHARERIRRIDSPRTADEVFDARAVRVADYSQGCIDAAAIRNVLVVKTDHIGDCVLALPAIQSLTSIFPHARFSVVCASWSREFFRSLDVFDSVIPFDIFCERSGDGMRKPPDDEIGAVRRQLHAMQFDLAIDLRRNPQSRWVLGLAGAKYTVGFAGSSEFHPVIERELSRSQEDRLYNREKIHISRQLMELVSYIPVQRFDRSVRSLLEKGLCSRDEARERLLRQLAVPSESGDRTRLVGIHPGAGDKTRRWPIDSYVELATALSREPDTYLCFFGGRNDSEEIAAVTSVSHERSACFIQMPYRDFVERLRGLDVFVGNNSGPGQLAAALGTPTVIVYSGTTSPDEWAPIGERVLVVDRPVACSPCYIGEGGTCPFDFTCLSEIKPSAVLKAIASLTNREGTRSRT